MNMKCNIGGALRNIVQAIPSQSSQEYHSAVVEEFLENLGELRRRHLASVEARRTAFGSQAMSVECWDDRQALEEFFEIYVEGKNGLGD